MMRWSGAGPHLTAGHGTLAYFEHYPFKTDFASVRFTGGMLFSKKISPPIGRGFCAGLCLESLFLAAAWELRAADWLSDKSSVMHPAKNAGKTILASYRGGVFRMHRRFSL
ncbi:hypothetical protein predicted by Glimmer/Critica [Acetobacter senegalensis]|uniref:Uncharacterized protein n=1 Tax=Acetobacter senegalensis TaxID=446692 RepID=A0A0U5EY08_9PROT|nr:hypothetical protein predicted by Glimmer/Critica [Acetobacter senegalensis]